MKKVLFITYFWPPSGKASAHWPLKIIKHLPKFGLEPAVLTVEEETFSQKDESLLSEIDPLLKVYKTKAFEPFNLYRKFTGKSKEDKLTASETISLTNKSLTHKISIWIRMNLFVPDSRVGWYLSAVKKGREIIKSQGIEAIVTIGPPHSTHLIGLKLSKESGVDHYPVFIDPWVDIVYYRDFKRNRLTLAADNYFEKRVLKNARAGIFVTDTMKRDYIKKYPFIENKSHVLYWGYDEDAFTKMNAINNSDNNSEFIVHAGNIFDYQNPEHFWPKLKELISSGEKLKIKFIGSVSPVITQAINKTGLSEYTTYAGFLSYEDLIKELLKAKYLLVCATEPRHVPGKLFEYLRTGKPIIAFGDDNEEVKEILSKSNAGMIFHYKENAGSFFINSGTFKTNFNYIEQFDREKIAENLAAIILS